MQSAKSRSRSRSREAQGPVPLPGPAPGPLEFVGEVVGFDANAQKVAARELATPWRQATFALAGARIRSGSRVRTSMDLVPGQRIQVRYTAHGAERRAQHVEILEGGTARLPPGT